MTTALNHNIAVALVYLMDGFDAEHQRDNAYNEYDSETYKGHADLHGGHIGIVSDLYAYAEWIELYVLSFGEQDFPGVIQYEVYESLGEWIFQHPEKSYEEFKAYAKTAIDHWFAVNSLNASQLADVTKEESTTMKISDLISQLDSLKGDLGDVDVVIGGSAPGKFIDVQEVRRVKTPRRTTVYIGKQTKPNAQE